MRDLMMEDDHWPPAIPFYSSVVIPRERLPGGVLARLMLGRREVQLVWLRDVIHAVTFQEDRRRMISTSLAVLALTQPYLTGEDGAVPPVRSLEIPHPRYRCEERLEYVARLALLPFAIG